VTLDLGADDRWLEEEVGNAQRSVP